MVIISNIILLVILGLNCFDDGPDVSLIEDGLRHLRHVDGGTSQKKLLHQQLYPMKIILVRGASFKLNLQTKRLCKESFHFTKELTCNSSPSFSFSSSLLLLSGVSNGMIFATLADLDICNQDSKYYTCWIKLEWNK